MDAPVKLGRSDVVEAATRIRADVLATPLVEADIEGRRLWLKAECAQTGGSFKLRGASNRLRQLTAAEAARGVVAFSSGNHAQGVAIAARRMGIAATIVMPADAPALKIDGTRAAGAEIVLYDRMTESREAIAAALADERGAVVVPSFDDPAIVAGQGTVGLEIVAQLGRAPARIVVPCGGGGLATGIALACPEAEIVVAEPEGWGDMGESLAAGRIVPVRADPPPTRCDALMTMRVADLTFDILRDRGASGVTVSEGEVAAAIRWAWREHGLTVEPGGAVALAVLLAGRVDGDDSVVVLSGGNVDAALFARTVG
ncbi:threonine/serine dehydratase [Sphingomonas sp. ASV193]|uniref:threonine ammonia-lyase n=1 Tax=Sphingomonas sp. ASV193 TaxID=3144405 RepID=UPI0032E872DC